MVLSGVVRRGTASEDSSGCVKEARKVSEEKKKKNGLSGACSRGTKHGIEFKVTLAKQSFPAKYQCHRG